MKHLIITFLLMLTSIAPASAITLEDAKARSQDLIQKLKQTSSGTDVAANYHNLVEVREWMKALITDPALQIADKQDLISEISESVVDSIESLTAGFEKNHWTSPFVVDPNSPPILRFFERVRKVGSEAVMNFFHDFARFFQFRASLPFFGRDLTRSRQLGNAMMAFNRDLQDLLTEPSPDTKKRVFRAEISEEYQVYAQALAELITASEKTNPLRESMTNKIAIATYSVFGVWQGLRPTVDLFWESTYNSAHLSGMIYLSFAAIGIYGRYSNSAAWYVAQTNRLKSAVVSAAIRYELPCIKILKNTKNGRP